MADRSISPIRARVERPAAGGHDALEISLEDRRTAELVIALVGAVGSGVSTCAKSELSCTFSKTPTSTTRSKSTRRAISSVSLPIWLESRSQLMPEVRNASPYSRKQAIF